MTGSLRAPLTRVTSEAAESADFECWVLGVGRVFCAAARGHGDGGGGVERATWQETRMEAWGSVVGGAPWKRRARVPSIRYTRRILEFGLRESRRTSSPTRLEREAWRPLVREGDIRSQQAKTLRGDRGTDVLRRKSYIITSLTMSTLRSIQASPQTSSNTTLSSRLFWPLPACTSPLFPSRPQAVYLYEPQRPLSPPSPKEKDPVPVAPPTPPPSSSSETTNTPETASVYYSKSAQPPS